jgi:hypothetical protein
VIRGRPRMRDRRERPDPPGRGSVHPARTCHNAPCDAPLPHDCRGVHPPAVALLHHRRRGGDLRRAGHPSFDRIRYRRHDASSFLYPFDLIDLNGDDLDWLKMKNPDAPAVKREAEEGRAKRR